MRFGAIFKSVATLWLGLCLTVGPALAGGFGDMMDAAAKAQASVDKAQSDVDKAQAQVDKADATAHKVKADAMKAKSDVMNAEAAVKGEISEVEANVAQSGKLMKKTYEADLKKGESQVKAAGDSYESVLEAGRMKAGDKK